MDHPQARRRLNEVNGPGNPADDLSPGRQAQQARLGRRLCSLSVHLRHHLNTVGLQAALARPQNSQVLPGTHPSKVAEKLSDLSAARHRQPGLVRVSDAAVPNEDSRATANLACRQLVRALVNREGEKSVGNLASRNLQLRRLAVQVRAKPEAEMSEGKVPTVSLAGSQKAEPQLRSSKGRGNPQRKRARGLHRQEDHNNSWILAAAASLRRGVCTETQRHSAVATIALRFAPRSMLRL